MRSLVLPAIEAIGQLIDGPCLRFQAVHQLTVQRHQRNRPDGATLGQRQQQGSQIERFGPLSCLATAGFESCVERSNCEGHKSGRYGLFDRGR